MAFGRATWWPRLHAPALVSLPILLLAILLPAILLSAILARPASADKSAFRTYNAEQNLSSLGGSCMVQDTAGYLLVCTEHGVFAYDGRRFVNLGPAQGLREGGRVFSIAITQTGRVAVAFADEVLVSNEASDTAHPPSSLSFKAVATTGGGYFDERVHRLIAWRDGLVLLAGKSTWNVVVPSTGDPHTEKLEYEPAEAPLLSAPRGVFVAGRHFLETFEDHRICQADPGAVRCWGEAEGLHGGPWLDIASDTAGRFVARSARSVATLKSPADGWQVTELPDQGGRYVSFTPYLSLFKTPDGGLATQADHGLALLGKDGWRLLPVEDGAPSGTIASSLTDISGQLWFKVIGRGLVRWVGYGQWETVQKADGLSDGFTWKTVRAPGGSLWAATDTGVDEIVRSGSSLHVSRVFPGASFALAIGPRGELWRGYESVGVRIVDLATGASRAIETPPVNVIVSGLDDVVWLGTQGGLYRVADRVRGATPNAVLQGAQGSVVSDIVSDRKGGAYYLTGGLLRHHTVAGADIAVSGKWPSGGFEPLALALDPVGGIWIGGAGGLYHFAVSGDRLVSAETIPTADTRTNSVVAVLVDHRGWVWAGTASGVSVFNGQRWVSVDADGGLASDDVDQNGLEEDPDGTIWITTAAGLCHLLNPDWLFTNRPVRAVISGAVFGSRRVVGDTMPYTTEALTLQFGTPNDGAERSFLFRYNLSGVDTGWGESLSGLVRYPSVPPGHHVLTLIGYDQLTHHNSAPATLVIDMAYPWWRQWWVEGLSALCVGALVYGVAHLRFRAILAREDELKRRIHEATEKLQYQAAHDSLTGLFNRSEIERRLAEKLSDTETNEEMIIALVDIDHFKRINDGHGHLGGDDVLRAVGRLVAKVLNYGEYAGRYGGEELLLVLSDVDGCGAERVLELHHVLRGTVFAAAGHPIRMTCSIGVAWARQGDNWETLIGRADDALYKAKTDGRDRVVESGRLAAASTMVDYERRVRPSAL